MCKSPGLDLKVLDMIGKHFTDRATWVALLQVNIHTSTDTRVCLCVGAPMGGQKRASGPLEQL